MRRRSHCGSLGSPRVDLHIYKHPAAPDQHRTDARVSPAAAVVARRDPHAELLWEVLLAERAKRRLIEHELTRRRTLLVLTVLLPIVGVVLALIGEPYAAGGLAGSGVLVSGVAALQRREERER